MNKNLILIFIICLFMTGCWNYNELNSLAITTAMAIDKKDNKYEVSILIANSRNKQSSTEEGQSQTVVYSSTGDTISEALKNIDLENPRQTYIGHLSALIISEEVAKEGLLNLLDLLFRNSESTKRFYIAIARDYKAKDIIKVVSTLEAFPSQTISTNIKSSSESQAVSIAVIYSDFIDNIIKKGKEAVLPTITIEGNKKKGEKNSNLEVSEPKARLKLDTVAVFKDDKLISFASKDESRGINLALNKIKAMIIQYKCDKDYLVSEINSVNTNISLEDKKVVISVKADGDIIENTCDIDLTDEKEIKKVENDTEDKIKSLIRKGLNYTQKEIKLDVYGIGDLTYKANPKFYKSIDNWNEYFSNIDIDIKVNTRLISKGSSRQSLKEALDGN